MKKQKEDYWKLDDFFTCPKGNSTQINKQGQKVLEEILNHPDKILFEHKLPQFGEVIDIKIQGKRGVRYYKNGELIGFLEP